MRRLRSVCKLMVALETGHQRLSLRHVLWLYYITDIISLTQTNSVIKIDTKKTMKITDRESDYLYITTTALISQLSSSEIESSPSSAE